MKKWWVRVLKGLGIVVGVVVVLAVGLAFFVRLTWDRPVSRPAPDLTAPTDAEAVTRGMYLYNYTQVCWFCHGSAGSHSPGEPQAGGREFDATNVGPGFGYLYGSNITPDPETGIGGWSDGEVVRAIREGIDREGRLIFPIMEAEWYHGMSDEDVLALVGYLRSLPPTRNEVPVDQLSFAAKALMALGMIEPQPPVLEPVVAPPRGATAEYGEYLALHGSMCAGCHTPRSASTGVYDMSRPFGGGDFLIQEEGLDTTGPNLTPDAATGIGDWSEEQFGTAMRTGVRPDGTVMVTFMPWPAYAHWTDDDLRAVWLYLRSLEPVAHEAPASVLTGTAATGTGAERGEGLYGVYCATCHGGRGTGSLLTETPLRDAAPGLDEAALATLIAEGLSDMPMPGYGATLTEEQIADLAAFIRTW